MKSLFSPHTAPLHLLSRISGTGISRTVWGLILSLGLLPALAPVLAQTEPSLGPPANAVSGLDDATPNQEELDYKDLLSQVRKNEREINRLYSSMPIGFPERQQQFLAKIELLTEKNNALNKRANSVAIESFRRKPEENPEAARIIYKSMLRKLAPVSKSGLFDPEGAREMGMLLINSGLEPEQWPSDVSNTNTIYQVFRACFALEKFDQAEGMLKELEAQKIPLPPTLREQLKDAKERWTRETLIRRFETNTDELPRVRLETTEGNIVLELYENHAPNTVNNFVSLVEKNFYNDLSFFVVKPGEFVRAGCRNNNGTTDAGYRIDNELDREQTRDHFAGTISMYIDEAGTAGTQFIITHQPNRKLDGKYTAFGRVIEGMDVLLKLKPVDLTRLSTDDVSKIIKATVVRKRDHEYKPTIVRTPERS